MTDSLDLQQLDDDARWALLARHLAGEATAAQDAAVRRWLASDAARAQELAALRAATGELTAKVPEGLDVEAALAKVRTRMSQKPVKVLAQQAGRPRLRAQSIGRAPQRRWVPLAAAATLALAAGLGLFRREGRVAPSPSTSVATRTGQLDSLELPDGSRVILGPASRLEIAAGFAQGAREVTVRGEAIFSVVHDEARPFTVIAGAARMVDVGTEFRVRHAPDEVEVAVIEGIVDVTVGSSAAARLNAGDRAHIATGAAPIVRRGDVTEDDSALRRGALVFREAPMPRVMADLERWYGLRLVAAEEAIAQRRLTATFTTEGVDQVIEMLALALDVAADTQGDSVVLRPRRLRPLP
jgi:transmembrane sensor